MPETIYQFFFLKCVCYNGCLTVIAKIGEQIMRLTVCASRTLSLTQVGRENEW